MENCGGDQRLPPDGDEFPATYQEFSACTTEQYQYVGTSTRLTSRASNNPSSEGNGREDIDEKTSTSTSSVKYSKNLGEKNFGGESTKGLRVESTTKKNGSIGNNDPIGTYRECREKSNYGQTSNLKTSQSENHFTSSYGTSTRKREIISKPEVTERIETVDEPKRNSYVTSSELKNPEAPIVLTERSIEISSYYSKEDKTTSFEKIGNPRDKYSYESSRDTYNDKIEPDYPDSPPPPLPLTGPPKIDNSTISGIGKNIDKSELISNRKYSLNDSRRQDDKSEKSVRDKIAMFSSQSSLESPLFPGQTSTSGPVTTVATMITSNARKLAKYKSSDDVFNDEKDSRVYARIERTQSFVDLTDTNKFTYNDQTSNYQRPPTLPKTLPPDDALPLRNTNKPNFFPSENHKKSTVGNPTDNREFYDTDFKEPYVKTIIGSKIVQTSPRIASKDDISITNEQKIVNPTEIGCNNSRLNQPCLTRATSFSGETNFAIDLSQSANSTVSNHGQVARTNSLASTFRRNSEDMRRQSLNQLIEQRRRGISKLRGLVIPEKSSVPADKPIIDLPEIKSRDSILLHQLPKSSIQDKWGSQSSLASNASTASLPMKATTSFKMPAPQIMSKYSPAFKRKSLAVYGSGTSNSVLPNTLVSTTRGSGSQGYSGTPSDPPKSLESICSPTRSDYSFEYATSTRGSPETPRNNRVRPLPRNKIRGDYDDSDNDSAVSSSQSSISRGFSPPASPVPSERSSLSSERSYHASLIMDVPSRHYAIKDNSMIRTSDRNHQHSSRSSLYSYPPTERSSSGSSSCDSPNARSPDVAPRSSHIPQRQPLKRSSSTETNCSGSSTLTSGSQASAESLSRRVLKPQSVEAINRKNILASARCRSGRDLNGSPLIQRKFSGDEELPISSLAQENGEAHSRNGSNSARNDVKIAYIEITENCQEPQEDHRPDRTNDDIVPEFFETVDDIVDNPELPEASNGLKMWVRTEAKALMTETTRARSENPKTTSLESSSSSRTTRSASKNVEGESGRSVSNTWNKSPNETRVETVENYGTQIRNKSSTIVKDTTGDTLNEDLLTTLTTKSRSRAPINLEDRSFGRTSRQMSLEDILVGKNVEEKITTVTRSQSSTIDPMGNGKRSVTSQPMKLPPATLPRNGRANLGDQAWSQDSSFVSKIPMPEKTSRSMADDDSPNRTIEKSRLVSKIPSQRALGKRSVSVNDMKKALERTDSISGSGSTNSLGIHNRFPSLDSSVEENPAAIRHIAVNETERFNGEQFGSISSLASSTSLISQQELAQLVEEASGLEDSRGNHEVVVVLLHKENPHGSVGITLAGGADCEAKEITVHRVLGHSIADKDGRVQRGDRILSINGRSTRGLTHRESLAVLKQPRNEIVLVVSRSRFEEGPRLRSRTESVETIVEGSESCGSVDETAWGPATRVTIFKDGAGLGFSLAGGRDSPLGDRPLVIKKIFTGGAAEKTASLTAGDQLIEVNGIDVTRMTRIEAWSLMKKLSDGEANLLVRHPATKSS